MSTAQQNAPQHRASQVWLITGSSRGIGRALTIAVLEAGHQLVATARNPAQLTEIKQRFGDRVETMALDVTDAAAAERAAQATITRFGRLDVVVNNAGYGNTAAIEDIAIADFRAQIETNFFGVVHVTRAVLPILRRQRTGHIIQIASIGGRLGTAGLGAYQAAKWAVEGFSESLFHEVKPFGVKVTIIEPGGFRTDWAGASMTIPAISADYQESVGAKAAYTRAHAGKENGDPAKAAQAILKIAALDQPPLRLLLGSDALRVADIISRTRAQSDQDWRELTVSTDFNDEIAATRQEFQVPQI